MRSQLQLPLGTPTVCTRCFALVCRLQPSFVSPCQLWMLLLKGGPQCGLFFLFENSHEITFLSPCGDAAENSVDGMSFRPDDVLYLYSGVCCSMWGAYGEVEREREKVFITSP